MVNTKRPTPPGPRPGRHKAVLSSTDILVEPYYRRQPMESDTEYKLFLIYRDLPWESRSLRHATAVALGVHLNTVHAIHTSVVRASGAWNWPARVNAYDLFIQENNSEREEKIRLQIKSKIERLVYNLIGKIERIEKIEKAEDLDDPEVRRDMAILQAMIGKERAAAFLLDAYKTIVGQKVTVAPLKNIPQLEWKTA